MAENTGFVVSDKNRTAVFVELAHGERSPDHIAKKHHLLKPAVHRVLGEFLGAGLAKRGREGFALTPEGEKVAAELRRQGLLKV